MDVIKIVKITIIALFLVTACDKQPDIVFDQTVFGGIFHRNESLLDSLQTGDTLTVKGVYDYRVIAGREIPVLLSINRDGQVNHALLRDSLNVAVGTFVQVTGSTGVDTIRIRGGNPVVLKSFVPAKVQALFEFGDLKNETQTCFGQYQSRIREYYSRKNIDLNLPNRFFWQIVYDDETDKIIVYTLVERISQIIEMDFVYNTDEQLQTIYVMEIFKGE